MFLKTHTKPIRKILSYSCSAEGLTRRQALLYRRGDVSSKIQVCWSLNWKQTGEKKKPQSSIL